MSRLYTNENFPLQSTEQLRKLGHDVLTIQESGNAGTAMTDEEVLAFACRENRILITMNRKHFIRLHQQSNIHSGIIVCNYNPDFFDLAQKIHSLLLKNKNFAQQLFRVHK